MLASSACADSAWNRSASWPSTSAARSAAPRSIILALSSAARARSSAAASRPRANRYPIAAPMTNPEQQSGQQQDCTHMQR